MSSINKHQSEHERNQQTGAPLVAVILSVIAIALIFLLPVGVIFWIAVIFPAIGVFNHMQLNSKAKRSGMMTLSEKVEGESERRVFGGMAIFSAVIAAGLIALLLYFFDASLLTWKYVIVTATAILWFLLGMMLWRFSSPTAKTLHDTATKGITYTMAIKSVVYAVLVQYAITEYFVGGNTLSTLIIVALVLLPIVLWYRASLLYKILGYHPGDKY